ncbi:MAG: tRNA 2-thiouridine(34) synthase MnmA [Pseudomonadota bacterium]|nr:tRNA 2-thiouridine(34) synthase MnmA [Pseudomonadota bacterium]
MIIDKVNFRKKNNLPKIGRKIVVAMSGGVDSSVTAAILKYLGYEVIGVTMKLYQATKKKNPKTCCSGVDIADARRVAKKLGIKHYIIDFKDKFKESVIDNFINSYVEGKTPVPCINCNQTVKFTDLLDFTRSINSPILATGHYVKRIETKEGINLYQANDKLKDQSYFLFATTQEQLKMLRFPLGSFSKTKIRKFAEFFELSVASKPDSQDICFIPDGNYREFVKKKSPNSLKKGVIENLYGEIIGKHNGIIDYTIGQRKGIGIGGIKGEKSQKPMYVIDIEKESNKIVVGPKDKLMKYFIYLRDLNFFARNIKDNYFDALVKIRSGKKLISAKVKINEKNSSNGIVELSEPEFGVAPGQACVFYNNHKKMIGGGWITASEKI